MTRLPKNARRGLKNECRSIEFGTTGSTGGPSLIVHGFEVLAQEIEFARRGYSATGRGSSP